MVPTTTSPELSSDPDVEAETLGPPQLVGVPADRIGQVQGRVAGPPGVVLVGDGGPEERHDAVAGELVDRPLEAVDTVGEDPHEPVHHREPVLGVEVLLEFHRPLHVGEEDRDLLVFPSREAREARAFSAMCSGGGGGAGGAPAGGGCGSRRRPHPAQKAASATAGSPAVRARVGPAASRNRHRNGRRPGFHAHRPGTSQEASCLSPEGPRRGYLYLSAGLPGKVPFLISSRLVTPSPSESLRFDGAEVVVGAGEVGPVGVQVVLRTPPGTGGTSGRSRASPRWCRTSSLKAEVVRGARAGGLSAANPMALDTAESRAITPSTPGPPSLRRRAAAVPPCLAPLALHCGAQNAAVRAASASATEGCRAGG